MEHRGDIINFSQREFGLCGLWSMRVHEASAIAAELYEQSEKLYKRAFSTPGDMRTFNTATELRLLADEVERHAPELDDENVARLFDGLETYLNEAS